MTKRKSLIIFVTVGLSCIALVVLLTGCDVPFFSDFFNKTESTFTVVLGDKEYAENAEGIILEHGATFTVKNVDEYEVTIFAKEASTDFSFLVDGTEAQWSDAVGTNFTKGFEIIHEDSVFVVTYTSFSTIIGMVLGYNSVNISSYVIPEGDLFDMRIMSGEIGISLCFSLATAYVGVDGLETDKPGIIFGETNA